MKISMLSVILGDSVKGSVNLKGAVTHRLKTTRGLEGHYGSSAVLSLS